MTTRVSRWAAFPLVCTFLALIWIAPARATGDFGGSGKFVGWWELGGFYGTDDSSRGEIVLFTPLMQSATTLFFLDARGKLFEEDVQEANLALGYRQMLPSGWNLGLWAGWDIRDTEVDNRFHQVSFGVEALSERFDVRVNGYVPVTDPKGSPGLAEVFLRGNNILMVGGEEVALNGVDGEVGMLLFGRSRGGGGSKDAPAAAKRHELRGYVGGFWFDDDDAIDKVAGPKGRLEYRINDIVSALPGSRLTIESELSYDEVRDRKFEIGARLRVPFGARGSDAALRTASLNAQELRMIEGLERDTDIITVQSKEESVIDDATNVAMNAVSFASNANQFANAVDKGGNRLIILQKGSQRIDVSATDGQQLQKNQTVQGGASTILMRGARTGTVAGFRAPGSRPTLFTYDGNFDTGAITLADNTHVAGLNIRGVGDQNNSVFGNQALRQPQNQGLDNVVIEQMDISKMGYHAIFFDDDNSNIRIADTAISNSAQDGVSFGNSNRNVFVDQLHITKIGGTGIRTLDSSRNVEIWNSTINDADAGILIGSENRDVGIHDVRIVDMNVGQGIGVNDDNRNVSISGVVIRNTAQQGIIFANSNRDVSLQSVKVANTAFDGIAFGFVNENVSVRDSVIKNTGFHGISFIDENANLTLQNIQIENAGSMGVRMFNQNTNVVIDGATIRDTFQEAIHIDNNNSDVLIANTKIVNSGSEGIDIGNNNAKVRILDTTLAGGAQGMRDGIEMQDFNDVTIRNVQISNTVFDGIDLFGAGNVVNISNMTVTNSIDDGIEISNNNNVVTMNNTTFSGTFGGSVIEIDNNTHTLAGGGNTFNGTFGGQFCDSGAQNGSFGFDVGPQATCP